MHLRADISNLEGDELGKQLNNMKHLANDGEVRALTKLPIDSERRWTPDVDIATMRNFHSRGRACSYEELSSSGRKSKCETLYRGCVCAALRL